MIGHPKVTVIMTTYNSERYLHKAISSILNQTFSDFELLILDDDSLDKTREIIASFIDPRIRLIINRERKGVAYARKMALEMSQGEYIAVLDSDDIAFSNRLQVQVDYLNRHTDVNLVGCAFEIINENGALLSTYHPPTAPLAVRWELLFRDVIGHSTVMFRRDVALELGGYDSHFLVAEDFDLWVRFAAYGKITQIDGPLIQWRFTPQSMQNKDHVNLKKYSSAVVMKSIRLQTDQDISFDIAQYLTSPSGMASSDAIELEAFKVLLKCYEYFDINIAVSNKEHKCLDSLATKKLLMIVREKPKSKYSYQILISAARIKSSCILSRPFLIALIPVVIPSSILDAIKRIPFFKDIRASILRNL
jgi:glycosyltransferase involved in cell wall biosynthesis